ncbi:DUF4426 domain-containing protein [Aequoribacter fuscus]|nr:DUF4426 domain-containing protein [Aequoribacter fuscus]
MPILNALFISLMLVASHANAQMSERFDEYELHYSFVNTTFLSPEIAAQYQITRGKRHGILMLSLRRHQDGIDGTQPSAMNVSGTTSDLIRKDELKFREIREDGAVYYIAPFKFINEEFRHFYIDFQAAGDDRTYSHHLEHQMYIHE